MKGKHRSPDEIVKILEDMTGRMAAGERPADDCRGGRRRVFRGHERVLLRTARRPSIGLPRRVPPALCLLPAGPRGANEHVADLNNLPFPLRRRWIQAICFPPPGPAD